MRRVAIIDDSTLARELLKRSILEVLGEVDVLLYANVKEARRALPNETLDHIFVDLTIGADGDGLTLIEQLRAAGQNAPTTLVTANIQAFVRDAAQARGIGYVAKPITNSKLAAIFGIAI